MSSNANEIEVLNEPLLLRDEEEGAPPPPTLLAGPSEAEAPTQSGHNPKMIPTENLAGDQGQVIFEDHPSLPAPSDVILFEDKVVHIYGHSNGQFLLEHCKTAGGLSTENTLRNRGAKSSKDLEIEESAENNEEKPPPTSSTQHIVAKHASDVTTGLRLLRLLETTVAFLIFGFVFIAGCQFLLYLVIGIANDINLADGSFSNVMKVLAGGLSIPCFAVGLSSATSITYQFMKDTWGGLSLVKTVLGDWFQRYETNDDDVTGETKNKGSTAMIGGRSVKTAVAVEWVAFLVFVGIPMIVLCISLLTGSDNWWTITALTWIWIVFLCSVLFGVIVTLFEISVAFEMICYLGVVQRSSPLIEKFKQIILLAKRHHLSATYTEIYFGGVSDKVKETTTRRSQSWYSKIVSRMPSSMFEKYDEPKKLHDITGAEEALPFVTSTRWDLSKIFCRNPQRPYAGVFVGPGAVKTVQMRSGIICGALGAFLEFFALISFLVWFSTRALVAVVLCLGTLWSCVPTIRRTMALTRTFKLIQRLRGETENGQKQWKLKVWAGGEAAGEENDEEDESESIDHAYSATVHEFRDVYWINKPTETLCWTSFWLETIFLVLFPFITFLAIGYIAIAIIFLPVCLLTHVRYYYNGAWVVREIGRQAIKDIELKKPDTVSPNNTSGGSVVAPDMDLASSTEEKSSSQWKSHWHHLGIPLKQLEKTSLEQLEYILGVKRERSWRVLHRLDMLSGMYEGKAFRVLSSIFLVLGVLLLILLVNGVATGEETSGDWTGFTMVGGYSYPGEQGLPYPTCQIAKGLEVPGGHNTTLLDFAYLAKLAYSTPATAQQQLDNFFGPNFAVNRDDIINTYRTVANQVSPVTYLFVTFPDKPNYGVVSVKGTGNAWDMLADAQLWSAAAFFQVFRFLLPFGEVWTPVMDNLVKAVSVIESKQMNEVSYYKEVSDFINFLKSSTPFTNIVVTGHSLGGGTAIISASQTEVPAIALSGPNAKMSKLSFHPPLTNENIDKYTFNIMPERDLISLVDDPGMLNQKIKCQAPLNDPFACHSSTRSICEIMYTCGSYDRPAICECINSEYQYPSASASPGSTGDFAAACASAGAPTKGKVNSIVPGWVDPK